MAFVVGNTVKLWGRGGGVSVAISGRREFRSSPGWWMGRRSEKIKNRKSASERLRTKIYARCGKMITTAVKSGGPDPTTNKALANALDFARSNSVPKDNIERAIERASNKDQADFKEGMFETYGHGGAGILIQVLTDNSNRAAAEIRGVLNKHQLKIASAGSVSFNFDRRGILTIPDAVVKDGEEFMLAAIEAGAEECEPTEEPDEKDETIIKRVWSIQTLPEDLFNVKQCLEDAGYQADSASLEMVPKTFSDCAEEEYDSNLKAIELLEDLDDVDGVAHNMRLIESD